MMPGQGQPIVTCEECQGRGFIDVEEEQEGCPTCDGSGVVEVGELAGQLEFFEDEESEQ